MQERLEDEKMTGWLGGEGGESKQCRWRPWWGLSVSV